MFFLRPSTPHGKRTKRGCWWMFFNDIVLRFVSSSGGVDWTRGGGLVVRCGCVGKDAVKRRARDRQGN